MKALCGAILLVLTSGTAAAQANRWQRQVQEQLERVSPHSRTTKTGVLNLEESEWFAVTLTAGVSYSIIGVCDNDCSSLQLVLATPDRNELVTDRRGENFPVVRFTPPETRVFRVKVVMDACLVSPCWYGVAVVERQ
jgi:hypothetical protein